jgi:hypothetical protein
MIELRDIPFSLDAELLMRQQHITPGSEFAKTFTELVREVEEVGRPKAIYEVSYIDEKSDDSVVLNGVRFTSRTLRRNLDSVERVFAYIATCGTEADAIATPGDDVIAAFSLWTLKQVVLKAAIEHLRKHFDTRYRITHSATMNPGSGDADLWPIEQQKELFSIFAGAEERIGVRLTDTMLMIPTMSESGIVFPTEAEFESCQICHRERCPNRKAPFDEEVWQTMRTD